jgi:hypothetical protein
MTNPVLQELRWSELIFFSTPLIISSSITRNKPIGPKDNLSGLGLYAYASAVKSVAWYGWCKVHALPA